MTMKARVLSVALVILAALWSTGCGHYDCGITKGNSTCSSGGSSTKTGGGGGPTGDAFIYVADAGGIQGMTFTESTGAFVDNCSPTTCPTTPTVSLSQEWAVIAQTKFLYVLYSTSGQIYGWTIAADGSLTNIAPGVYPFQLSYTFPEVGNQAMITNPAGTLLFVLNPTSSLINVYTIGSAGTLAVAGASVPLPAGFGEPFNMAIDGQGKYLYVSNIVGGSSTTEIQAYSIGSTGLLTSLATYSASTNPQFGLMQMQGDASGKYLIGTKGSLQNTDTNLYVLSIASNGTLTPVGSPVPTVNPPDQVAIQPNTGGTLVYSLTLTGLSIGGPLEGFTLNSSTGALTSLGAPFSAAGDMMQFDQAGKFLFVRDLFGKSMSAYDVSSSSTLSQSVGSVGWGDGAWAPTDIP